MKKITTIVFIFCSMLSFGQLDFEDVLDSGSKDAQTLLRGFLQPISTGFGTGINGGWYTTAKAHKLFGIDIAVIANASLVPTNDETFTFNSSDYSSRLQLDNGGTSAELPTIFGSSDLADRPLLKFTDSNGNSISTSALPGFKKQIKDNIGFNAVPSAMLQVGVGLFKNTDLKVRFIPKQTGDDYEVSSFGIGIMHDLKQWIPFVKRLPVDVSGFIGWNNVKSKVILDSNTSELIEFNTKTFMWQLLASKKLSIFTLYGGVGAASFETDLSVQGYSTPLDFKYDDGSSLRTNIGLSMKLFFINIAAEYAKQEYDIFSVRAGFSIR